MTFRIFSGDARKAIADHIIGAPPVIPNRHGSNHGTDLLVQGGTIVKTEYIPDPGGEYDPDPGGDPHPPGTLPPTTGPGGTVQIDCPRGIPADNAGKCDETVHQLGDNQTWRFIRKVDASGMAYCCPTRSSAVTDPQPPPQTYGDFSSSLCPDGNSLDVVVFNTAETNTVNNSQPFAGKTPAQYIQERESACEKMGNTFNVITFQGADDTQRTAAGCCGVLTVGDHTLGTPPTVTPVTDPVPPIYGHDGATGGDATPPATTSITCHGPVIQDIAAKKYGYMNCEGTRSSGGAGGDCVNRLKVANSITSPPAHTYSPNCATMESPLMMVLNPSSATIAAGTVVVAVRNNTYADSEGTILFVPCST